MIGSNDDCDSNVYDGKDSSVNDDTNDDEDDNDDDQDATVAERPRQHGQAPGNQEWTAAGGDGFYDHNYIHHHHHHYDYNDNSGDHIMMIRSL